MQEEERKRIQGEIQRLENELHTHYLHTAEELASAWGQATESELREKIDALRQQLK